MHRLRIEAIVVVALSLFVATFAFMAGQAMPDGRTSAALSSPTDYPCREQAVQSLDGSQIGGTAQLCVTPDGIGALMQAERLVVGETYTLWLTYLDHERGSAAESVGDAVRERPASVAGPTDWALAHSR